MIESVNKALIFEPLLSQSQAFARLLKSLYPGIQVHAAGESPSLTQKLYYDLSAFDQFVGDKVNYSNYDIVIPTGAASTEIALKAGNLQIGDVGMNTEALVVNDKFEFLQKVKSLSIPIPETTTDPKEVKGLPAFYKELTDNPGAHTKSRGVIDHQAGLLKMPKGKYLYQEYISSPYTYGVGFIAKDGEIREYQAHKELSSIPASGGSAVTITVDNSEKIIDYTKKIVSSIGYSGWGLAEFKYCEKRNDFVFMEVNAKLWASIEFTWMNNPEFIKPWFGMKFPGNNISKAVFLDRAAEFGFGRLLSERKQYDSNEQLNSSGRVAFLRALRNTFR